MYAPGLTESAKEKLKLLADILQMEAWVNPILPPDIAAAAGAFQVAAFSLGADAVRRLPTAVASRLAANFVIEAIRHSEIPKAAESRAAAVNPASAGKRSSPR
jgi:hypothetical protein